MYALIIINVYLLIYRKYYFDLRNYLFNLNTLNISIKKIFTFMYNIFCDF